MKKLLMLIAMFIGTSTVTFANDVKKDYLGSIEINKEEIIYDGEKAYDFSGVSMYGFYRYLHLNYWQRRKFEIFYYDFVDGMKTAYECYNREYAVSYVVKKNLFCMKEILTEEQYKDYLKVLNVTFRYRGLKVAL